MINVTPISALRDNYIWVIHNETHAVVVDPGEASSVIAFLCKNKLQLSAILCTHHHADHINGIPKITALYHAPVYGYLCSDNPYVTIGLCDNDELKIEPLGRVFKVLKTPGHVNSHLVYVSDDGLFSGDILFGAGCGRNFEGTLTQLHYSLQRIAQLPESTLVYCAHEYTANNLRFALACEPDNQAIQNRIEQVAGQRLANLPTLPTTIGLEKKTNPFLRCTETALIQTVKKQGLVDTTALNVFIHLRTWRNTFQ